ncbi:MAG: glycogen synthase GlgA [Deltaproteobacteria bacterium]|nr:glycogen synthase GlgA [Deltaproteobacteria bacterium]
MRVLHVASEVAPFAQSGGLADVVAGLPAAQAQVAETHVGVLVPMYRGVAERLAASGVTLDPGTEMFLSVGPHVFRAALRRATIHRVEHGFVDCAALFDRPGNLYGPGGPAEWPDNHLRFAALGQAALAAGELMLGARHDVLHVHDWQGGPAAIYARLAANPPTIVTTIHNLAYRGIFPKSVMTEVGFPWSVFTSGLVEFYDQVSFLKGALAMSDVVTTVSPSYAKEILTPVFGEALDGFLVHHVKRLVGIVNGIDTDAWDPATDTTLPAPYSAGSPAGKAACKRALADEIGLPLPEDEPLIGVIARMTGQKGLDLVAEIAPELHRLGARLAVLGAGEPDLETQFTYLATTFSEHVYARIGFDIGLARRIYASSDLFVMPSRFEPCGLGQLYAMRYGAIPIVHAVGGLRDTVIDPGDRELARGHGTGITFAPATAPALLEAIERGIALFRDRRAFAALRTSAMSRDSSWTASARDYLQLYASLRM